VHRLGADCRQFYTMILGQKSIKLCVNSRLSRQWSVCVIRNKCAAGFEEKKILYYRGGWTDRHTVQGSLSSRGGDNLYCSLLDYDTAYSGRRVPTFRRNLLQLWSRKKLRHYASPIRRQLSTDHMTSQTRRAKYEICTNILHSHFPECNVWSFLSIQTDGKILCM
jgi:hypothetical protein